MILWIAGLLVACNFMFALGYCIGVARERRQRKAQSVVLKSRSPFYRSKNGV
jgi:hypothetical protein